MSELPLGARTVEAYVDGPDVSSYIDPTFLGLLSKRLPGIRAVAVTFAREVEEKDVHGDRKFRVVTIWYPDRPKGTSIPTVSVDTDSPEELDGALNAMNDFAQRSKG
jgi:hypothetical protein